MSKNTREIRLSADEFANLGAPDIVYIRPVKRRDGATTFAIHAANGAKLADLPNRETALITARTNELHPVSLH
ncbi:MAG: DUF1150 family protein [Rhodothalassiaceae bacterium]